MDTDYIFFALIGAFCLFAAITIASHLSLRKRAWGTP
jgi:hypothetical protein